MKQLADAYVVAIAASSGPMQQQHAYVVLNEHLKVGHGSSWSSTRLETRRLAMMHDQSVVKNAKCVSHVTAIIRLEGDLT